MATLEKIRNQAGLLVIVVGLALFAFIIGDFLNSGSTYMRQSQDQVANVNGTIIHYQDYIDRIEEMSQIYKMQLNSGTLTEEQIIQVRQNVYDAMVNEIVLYGALDKLGIKVTPDELFEMVQGDNISPMVQQFPYFLDQETGSFNKMQALNVLKTIENIESVAPEYRGEIEQIRNYWLFWERNIKIQTLQSKYLGLLSKAVVVNPLEAKDAFESTLENSDIIYAMQSFSSIPDSAVNVSESEIQKIYNQRKEQYKQQESRVFDYIAVETRPSQEDYDQVRVEANKVFDELVVAETVEDIVNATSEVPYWNAFVSANAIDTDMQAFVENAEIGDTEGPLFREDSYRIFRLMDKTIAADSVNVSHIHLSTQSTSIAEVQALADSVMDVLKTGGDFEFIAARHSIDQSGQNGGLIGWMTEMNALGYFGSEFKDAIFAAPINQPFVFTSNYGTQILKITEKTANVPKYKLAYIHLSVTPSTKTISNLYNELNQFISINNSIEKMEAAASDAGYVLNSNIQVTQDERSIGSIPDSRPVIKWAFDSKKKGELSSIFECKNHFIIAARRGALPEGYQSVQSLTPLLKIELSSRLKGEKIAEDLKSKNLRTINNYAEAIGTQVDTVQFINFSTSYIAGIGMEPKLNASIAFSPLNQISEPVIGNNGVYVFSVINRSKAADTYDEQTEINKLEPNISYRAGYSAYQSLMDNAKIEDNRIRFE